MTDFLRLEKLKRIENIISEGCNDRTYRECLLASLVAKNFTVKTAQEISKKNMLLCTVFDMNFAIALKYQIRISEFSLFNDEANLRYVINSLSSEEPLTIINNEVKEVLTASKELIFEIQNLLKDSKHKNQTESIIKLFNEKTQKAVECLIKNSFYCYKFDFSGILLFERQDESTLQFETELASTRREWQLGLSQRPFLPDGAAMLYEANKEQVFRFVTTDVERDLSVAYIKADGTISEIVERKANDTTVYSNKTPSQYVFEVTKGWFKENNIHVGDSVKLKTIIAAN